MKLLETKYASYFILLERMIELHKAQQLTIMTKGWSLGVETKTKKGKRVRHTVKIHAFRSDANYVVFIIAMVF